MSGFRFCVTKVNENAILYGIHFQNFECTLCGRFVLGTFVVNVFVCLLKFFTNSLEMCGQIKNNELH